MIRTNHLLDYFRQHKQMTGFLLMPVLLLVWLSLTCQDCEAVTLQDSAKASHLAMDCCPPGSHSGEHDHMDMSDCDSNQLMSEPAISAEAAVQLSDFQVVMLPVAELRFEASYPDLIQPIVIEQASDQFSNRLFSSYRILLI